MYKIKYTKMPFIYYKNRENCRKNIRLTYCQGNIVVVGNAI